MQSDQCCHCYSHNHRGASVARLFAKKYAVALLARNPENFEPLAKEISEAGGKAIGISTDASDSKSVEAAFQKLDKEFSGLPLAAAIYNVGGKFVRKPFLELSEDDFEAGWEANGYVEKISFGNTLQMHGTWTDHSSDEAHSSSLEQSCHSSSRTPTQNILPHSSSLPQLRL